MLVSAENDLSNTRTFISQVSVLRDVAPPGVEQLDTFIKQTTRLVPS